MGSNMTDLITGMAERLRVDIDEEIRQLVEDEPMHEFKRMNDGLASAALAATLLGAPSPYPQTRRAEPSRRPPQSKTVMRRRAKNKAARKARRRK